MKIGLFGVIKESLILAFRCPLCTEQPAPHNRKSASLSAHQQCPLSKNSSRSLSTKYTLGTMPRTLPVHSPNSLVAREWLPLPHLMCCALLPLRSWPLKLFLASGPLHRLFLLELFFPQLSCGQSSWSVRSQLKFFLLREPFPKYPEYVISLLYGFLGSLFFFFPL